ncbi:hypothetical protein [Cellulomonas bogoriensis]|uniref:Uncharacterized protein n=1 Tax=Cellulomonas bogoriensis 69B4 = DSM 16987 TaxID=1386082 RepID=A0A0A0BZA8_9CELL|nr:hypothetical protein [Cellulomonas bogoriensis]KGM13052.1 hypothetical protein N869_16470 [Cellulomonas bogoriensis 69B4 = DSM 16987]
MTTEPEGPATSDPDGATLDPAGSVALIDAQRARLEKATDVDGRILFGVWGLAWLLGFGQLWTVTQDQPLVPWSQDVAYPVFGSVLLAAMVVTTIHTAVRSSGLRGGSAAQGAMYGWAWFLTFAGVGALALALARLDASPDVIASAMTLTSVLLVAALYMAGGAIWQDRHQFVLGAWIAVTAIASGVVGHPHMLLVMALAGGGGMLVGAVVEHVRRRRGTAPRTQPLLPQGHR